MKEYIFIDMLDPDVLALVAESLPGLIIAMFGLIGASAALVSFLIFTVWGLSQTVKFVRSLIKA